MDELLPLEPRPERVRRRITVAADWRLVDHEFYIKYVWQPARERDKTMRSKLAWLTGLTMLYEYDGQYFYSDGGMYHLPDMEEVFIDPSNRWMTNFLQSDASGHKPKRFSHKLERLRLIELYCRLRGGIDWTKAAAA